METVTRCLCLTGPDGAGKSTQAEHLVHWLQERGERAVLCTPWDLLAADTIPFRDKGAVDRFLGSVHGTARALFLHLAVRESLDRALDRRQGEILVVVGYWLKYNATERVLGTDEALLDALGRSFPPLDLLLYLDVDPEDALARKPSPSRYECGGLGPEAFVPFQERAQAALRSLCRAHGGDRWQIIDARRDEATVAASLQTATARWLSLPPAESP